MKIKNFDLIKKGLNNMFQINTVSDNVTNKLLNNVENTVKDFLMELKSKYKISLDEETEQHSINVAKLSLLTGIALNLDENELSNLVSGALIHDVGKGFVSNEILMKPSKLTNEEMDEVKKHSKLGYNFVESLDLPEDVKLIVLDHHEKSNGKGYPANKKASEINYYAKIVSVCDVFEAFSSKRCYKDEVDFYVVMNFLLDNRGIQFDTEIVNAFHKSVYSNLEMNKVLNNN